MKQNKHIYLNTYVGMVVKCIENIKGQAKDGLKNRFEIVRTVPSEAIGFAWLFLGWKSFMTDVANVYDFFNKWVRDHTAH